MIAKQGHQQYVYRGVRQGDTVQRVYIGHVNSPAARQLLQEAEAKQTLKSKRLQLDGLADRTKMASQTIDVLLSSQMLANQYIFRKSEWRKGKKS